MRVCKGRGCAESHEVCGTGVVGAGRGRQWAFEPRPLCGRCSCGGRRATSRTRPPARPPGRASLTSVRPLPRKAAVDLRRMPCARRCIVSSVSRPASALRSGMTHVAISNVSTRRSFDLAPGNRLVPVNGPITCSQNQHTIGQMIQKCAAGIARTLTKSVRWPEARVLALRGRPDGHQVIMPIAGPMASMP
jgi:hypothetical protein